jgi:hypothetical protein
MTDQQHPITPPQELSDEQVGEWLINDGYPWDLSELAVITITTNRLKNVARQAFQAGADQELEACIAWFDKYIPGYELVADRLRAARRPKPPSLKEQALNQLREVNAMLQFQTTGGETSAIRRALESINE